MCQYITMFLPPCNRQDFLLLQGIAKTYHRKLDPIENASVRAFLSRDEGYFRTTKNSCDCGTSLGYAVCKRESPEPDYQRDIKRMQQKGWSETKITRWLLQKEGVNTTQNDATNPNINDDWYNYLIALLDSGKMSYVGLLLHWYRGSLSGSIKNIQPRQTVDLRREGVACLSKFKEDTLYAFF